MCRRPHPSRPRYRATQDGTRQAFAMVTQPAAEPKQAAPAVPNKRVVEKHRRRQPSRMAARGPPMFFNEPFSAGW